MGTAPALVVDGAVAHGTRSYTRADLSRLAGQIGDVALLAPGKSGAGVRLATLLADAGADAAAGWLELESSDAGFCVSIPRSEAGLDAVVLHSLAGDAYPEAKGGPFRFLAPAHPDECVQVKRLVRLRVLSAKGRDTRPVDDEEHRKLHEKKAAPPAR